MNLEQCALVTQGAFLSRVQSVPVTEEEKLGLHKCPLYSMKEMNEWLSPDPNVLSDNAQEVYVSYDRVDSLPIAREGWVLISLTGQRAVALKQEHVGKLIPSNFAIIEPTRVLSPDYLEWFINEHPDCRKQLKLATQGSSVAALSIQMLRTLEIILPPMTDQIKVGRVHRLLHRKNRLLQEKIVLEQQYARQIIMGYIKEEHK
ncbi:restriction endonuclease subunit S [Paenibacillus piri]|uniref:Restriction endonuclease subunit S n=1 Tax=Paenibacillus piri TaxID=2547395 RepID=A0A4R5KK23_9BACL|nr:restriction endonuclease subunit S [Paenibacillus piri]TDF94680.1 restriction endonuclease subunit S [Paenibacillus piri]